MDANDQVSPAFSRVILKCLEKDRSRRYQSADEVVTDLETISQGLPTPRPTTARRKPVTTRQVTVKFSPVKVLVPVVAVILAIAAGLIVIKPWASRKEGEKGIQYTRPDVLRRIKSEPPKEQAGQGQVEAPPPVAPKPGSAGGLDFSKVVTALTPIIGGAKASQLEGKSVDEIDQILTSLKDTLPPFSNAISDIQSQIREGRRQNAAGNLEASKKSYTKGESEMRKLLTLVNEKEKADQAKGEMEDAKKKAADFSRKSGQNLLAWIASEKERDALDSYNKNDFSGARILYGILGRVYGLSLRGGNEDQCLAALQGMVRSSHREADAAQAAAKEAWLYGRAGEEEAGAVALSGQKAYPEAAERFILAAFLYEKAKDVALESAQAVGK